MGIHCQGSTCLSSLSWFVPPPLCPLRLMPMPLSCTEDTAMVLVPMVILDAGYAGHPYAYGAYAHPYAYGGYAHAGRYVAHSGGAVHIAKREAEAEATAVADADATAEADADAYYGYYGHHYAPYAYGYAHRAYGYSGYLHPYAYAGHYGYA